ncbi:hypothetical protein MTO96_047414 [Rhipicephalus appendiculatus]
MPRSGAAAAFPKSFDCVVGPSRTPAELQLWLLLTRGHGRTARMNFLRNYFFIPLLLGAIICGWVHDVGHRVGDVSCSREILPSDVVWAVPVPADDLLQCTGELHYSNFSSGCIAGLLAVENCRAS